MRLDLTPYTRPLGRTPAMLRAVIEGQPNAWLDSHHAPGILSPREAVAHIVLCERGSWVVRAKQISEHGQVQPFAASLPMNEAELLATRSVDELLDEFEALREGRLGDLEALNLAPGDLEKEGSHQLFGTVTVGQLLATWVAHDLYHLGQIFKSYSALYVDEVGPWQHFLNLPHFN